MAVPESARGIVTRVRNVIQDRDYGAWSDAEILQQVDASLESVASLRRRAGQDHEIDRIDIGRAEFADRGNNWLEFQLPEYVLDVRRVEGLRGGREVAFVAAEGMLEDAPARFSGYSRGIPRWVWTQHGRPGHFSVFGAGAASYDTIRVWFIRRHPPLHFGIAAAGSTNQGLVFDQTTPIGVVVRRAGLYAGMDIEFTAGTLAGQLVRVESYDGTTAVWFGAPTGGVPIPAVGDEYSLMVPIEAEHTEFLVHKAAYYLAVRAGNTDYLAALTSTLRYLEGEFIAAMNVRSTNSPKRMWSSRQ